MLKDFQALLTSMLGRGPERPGMYWNVLNILCFGIVKKRVKYEKAKKKLKSMGVFGIYKQKDVYKFRSCACSELKILLLIYEVLQASIFKPLGL